MPIAGCNGFKDHAPSLVLKLPLFKKQMSSQGPEGVEAGYEVPDAPEEAALGARLGGGEGEEEEGGEEGGEPHGAGAVPGGHWGAGGGAPI